MSLEGLGFAGLGPVGLAVVVCGLSILSTGFCGPVSLHALVYLVRWLGNVGCGAVMGSGGFKFCVLVLRTISP